MSPLLRRLLRGADLVLFVIGMLFVALLVLSLTKGAFQMETWTFRVLSLAMALGLAFWVIRWATRTARDRSTRPNRGAPE